MEKLIEPVGAGALLDDRETDTTQHGVYVVFLFRQDMSGVYLTLAQEVTEPRKRLGIVEARRELQEVLVAVAGGCSGMK